jgi:hypothetical protein
MKNNLFISVIAVLFLISCEKENDHSSLLLGKWNWTYTYGGITCSEYTPKSTGDKIIIEYTSDSLFRRYVNDTLIDECKYQVIDSSLVFDGDKAVIIKYDGLLTQAFVMKGLGELYLYDVCWDGFEKHYNRIK